MHTDTLMLRDLLRDAARTLFHDRRFVAVAVTLLAITIGTITAVYAVVHGVVLRPFPFANQDRVVVIWQRDDRRAAPVIEVAYGEMADWARRSRSFKELAVVGSVNWSLTLAGHTEPEQVSLVAVSAAFFSVLGTRPALGRGFVPADERGARTMVLSHALWVRRFGRDPHIVGRPVPVRLDADGPIVPIEVVGVMPDGFDYPAAAEVYLPAAPLVRGSADKYGPDNAMRWLRVFYVVGRLRDGVSVESATRELTHVMRTSDAQGGPEPPLNVVVTPIVECLLGPAGPVLWTLLAGAALMLIIACANVAGLQVSRAARQQRALAVRLALGASPRRLVRQVVLESVLLTIAALAGAVVVAYVISRALVLLAPSGVPRLDRVDLLDVRVLLFGAAATFVTAVLSGLWPALVVRRLDAASVLAHGPGAAADPRGRRAQRTIVVAQIAVALTLLAGTGLFLRTVRGLDRTVLGFDPTNLLAVTVTPATNDLTRWNAFFDRLIDDVEALPGVSAAGAVALRPLSGPIGWDSQPGYPGQVAEDPATWGLNPLTNLEVVTPGYFPTMGIRLLRGRLFTPRDTIDAPGVVVVGESAARRLWPGREALGQRLRDPSYRTTAPTGSSDEWQTVGGGVADVPYRGLNDVRLGLYVPAAQSDNRVQHLMVRTVTDAAGIAGSIRAAARGIERSAGVSDASLMANVVSAESAPWRFLMRVFVAFAALSALLAAVGLSAVVALTVAARRRELAIRAALGADGARLRAVVLREGLRLVTMGVAFGVLGAIALGRGVAHVLIGVGPYDPVAVGAGAACAAGVGLLASWLPTRRADDINPVEALKAE